MQRGQTLAALVAADALTLLVCHAQPGAVVRHLGHPRRWLAEVGTDAALATTAGAVLWLGAIWLGLGLACTAARRLPGRAGALADRVSAAVLPRLVLRLVAGSAGLGVLLAPLPALAAGSPAPGTATSAPAPVRPGSTPQPRPSSPSPWPAAPAPPAVPAPRWPSTNTLTVHPPARNSGPVTVAPGDCLWLIAARRLGPHPTDAEITAQWPRWYAANRSVIGADPNLITPGEVLHAPPAHPSEARS